MPNESDRSAHTNETNESADTIENGGSSESIDAAGGGESSESADTVDPATAFDALADDTRIAILRGLHEAGSETREPVAFSTLYDQVDVDGSSTFSYHLNVLTGVYVRKTDDGYVLTATGQRLVQAVLGGVYTDTTSFDGATLDCGCPFCGHEPVELRERESVLAVHCPDCDEPFVIEPVQPAQLADRSADAVVRSFHHTLRRNLLLELNGTCASCSGPVSVTVERSEQQLALDVIARMRCRRCGSVSQTPPYFCLLDHPLVISFYWDHGVDLTDRPFWQVSDWVASGEWTPELHSTDPFEVRLTIERDGDRLRVTIDDDLRVIDATRREQLDPPVSVGSDNKFTK